MSFVVMEVVLKLCVFEMLEIIVCDFVDLLDM